MSKKECTGHQLSLPHVDTKPQNLGLYLGVTRILLLTPERSQFLLPKAFLELPLELLPRKLMFYRCFH